jgi:hypothetical protein
MAWIALADMFRDTELQPSDVNTIARTLVEAGLNSKHAHAVLFDEVAPVFGKNLISVAGNWDGWSDEFVVREVQAYLARRQQRTLRRFFSFEGLVGAWIKRGLEGDWARVQRHMDLASPTV